MSVSELDWNLSSLSDYPTDKRRPSLWTAPQQIAPASFLAHTFLQVTNAFNNWQPGNFHAMGSLSPSEMARFQQLSNEFEPELQGPLVSTKQSSHAIALEYANADPNFATKTNALAQTHPMMRLIKGDGNCGWRAVAFGYFENLFMLRNDSLVERELARIKSLGQILSQVCQEELLYEEFVEATVGVFSQVLQAIQSGAQNDSFLLDAFNDQYNSESIITHFRLLTSAWMRMNPARYQDFLQMPLEQYCATRIETVRTEIDEIGLQALIDGVIEESGIAVEVLYLDRSEGESVTPHLKTENQPSMAAIRLLYRPGHYDLAYQADSILSNPTIMNLQYDVTSNYSPWDDDTLQFDMNSQLMAVPGLTLDPSFTHASAAMSLPAPTPDAFSIQASPLYQPPAHPQLPLSSPAASPQVPISPLPGPLPGPLPEPRVSGPPPPMLGGTLPGRSSDGPQIRLNPLVMKSNLFRSLPVTTPLKNSPYNQAHFQNEDFEPIHWEPSESRK